MTDCSPTKRFATPRGRSKRKTAASVGPAPGSPLPRTKKPGPDSNRVKAGSLAVEGLVPVGNRAMLDAQYNRIRRQLATSVGGVFDAEGLVENQDDIRLVGRDGKQVYISFIQRVSKVDDGFYGVELHRGDGNGNRVLCIGNGADGASVRRHLEHQRLRPQESGRPRRGNRRRELFRD